MPLYKEYLSYDPVIDEPVIAAAGAVPELQPTPRDITGPFFLPGAPEKDDISEGLPDSFLLQGRVMNTVGMPLPDALLDFWQADPDGKYDETGYRHRGKVRTDMGTSPTYAIRTVRPGCYEIDPLPVIHVYRCPHIHVKVTVKGYKSLTTQLYFPDGPGTEHNDCDRWFDPRRVIRAGRFDFVLEKQR